MLYFFPKKARERRRSRVDRAAVKRQARAVVQGRRKAIFIASFLFIALAAVFSVISYKLTAPSVDDAMRYLELFVARDYSGAEKLLLKMQPSTRDTVISDVLSYLQAIVFFGFLMLMFKAVRGEPIETGMLLDGFGSWAKVLLLEILLRLLRTVGFLLLIFPGFWVLYTYRMARYLLLIHPEYGVFDCLRESRRRMAGHRTEFFLLDLSFLGWLLLALVPLLGLILAVWLLPYWQGADLLYCEAVNSRFEPAQSPQGTALP